jgi:hypothetical protein
MTGNWIGFITALLTFLAVAWQGYGEYQRQHPTLIQPSAQQGPPPGAPVYWQDGQQWYCKVGDQILVWRPVSTPATHVAQHDGTIRR